MRTLGSGVSHWRGCSGSGRWMPGIQVPIQRRNGSRSPSYGHPRNATAGLPTKRPAKYGCMVHADLNAALRCHGKISTHAVVYLPMPPCEVCLGAIANMPLVAVKRVVYLEYRSYPEAERMFKHLPHIELEQYRDPHPAEWLERAAIYARSHAPRPEPEGRQHPNLPVAIFDPDRSDPDVESSKA